MSISARNLLPFAFAALALSCASDNEFHQTPDAVAAELSSITGWVCDTERQTWLEGALVYTHLFDDDGVLWDTRTTITDADGMWTLTDMPIGAEYLIYVTFNNETLSTELTTIPDAAPIELPRANCYEDLDVNVAVITGDYDDFGELLGQLGVSSYETVNGQTGEELIQFLTGNDELDLYDAIFFNGGHLEEDIIYDTDGSDVDGVVGDVLRSLTRYVEGGGVVYASDWAYDVIEAAWPDKIDFLGDDTIPDAAQKGETGEVNATIEHDGMSSSLGETRLTVTYDMSVWPPIESVSQGVTTYMTGDITYREGEAASTLAGAPLLASFESGDGTVIFSTYRQVPNSDSLVFDALRFLLDRTL